MSAQKYVRWFDEIRLEDVPLLGGKNASLGELYATLASEGVRVPNGFALTASAYRDALAEAGAIKDLHPLLDGIDKTDVEALAKRAAKARQIVYAATGGDERDPGMLEMLRLAVTGAKQNGRHVGICGEAPANHPEIADFLTGLGIDSISVNPASLMQTKTVVREAEDGGQRRSDGSLAAQ